MRILLAEDERELATWLVRALAQSDFQVDWVDDGRMVRRSLKATRYDALILDLGLPGLGGHDVLADLREADQRLPVLILTALNLAQGKFGRYNENDVRWLAAIGADYGAVVVAESSPYKSLKDVLAAVKADPTKVVFGAGGTVGSQDWMKAAMTARAAGVNPKSMRFVAFEGGGEAMTALQGGHIQVFTGDAAETAQQIKAGSKVRILAVMADKRLAGDLANVPTAKEQGTDIEWPIIRGFYLGPKVSDADFKVWSDTFAKMMATPAYDKARAERGLYPFALTGAQADAHVKQQVAAYRKLAEDFGLAVAK